MAVSIQSVLREVIDELSDEASLRWTTSELVRYLNAGQREMQVIRPDQFVTTASVNLVAGAKQSLPAAAIKLVEITRNTGGKQRAVKITTRELLDAFNLSWTSMRVSTEVQHYTYDLRDPRTFYVYPPASVGTSVEMTYAVLPTDVIVPPDGTPLGAISGNVTVPDQFAGALREYVLFRAWSKEAEYANPQKAKDHYSYFVSLMGADGQATVQMGPSSTANPNKASSRTGAAQ